MRVFRAPGRVNLIGDHTDYSEGLVMPMAIQLETSVTATPLESRELVVESANAPGRLRVSLDEPLQPRRDWTDYVVGVANVLIAEGHRLEGKRLAISSNIPAGAGLSSSAALEVATGFALLDGNVADRVALARWCQRAENEFVGARVGIMDQYVACLGRSDSALLIDCRSLGSRSVPLPPDIAVVVSNTMVKHNLAAGEYNVRRAQCEEAARVLGGVLPHIRTLRDVTLADLDSHGHLLSGTIVKRARHVVSENARVTQAADALERHDFNRCGELMRESHRSLRDDFEVSVPELDLLVDLALVLPGVYGSRMTGGGFGGSTVSMVAAIAVESVVQSLRRGYARETGISPDLYVCRPSSGASELAA